MCIHVHFHEFKKDSRHLLKKNVCIHIFIKLNHFLCNGILFWDVSEEEWPIKLGSEKSLQFAFFRNKIFNYKCKKNMGAGGEIFFAKVFSEILND